MTHIKVAAEWTWHSFLPKFAIALMVTWLMAEVATR